VCSSDLNWRDLDYGIGQVGNINIEGNTISSTDEDGNITLAPNGSGGVYVNSDLFVLGDVYSQSNKRLATVEYVDSVAQGLDVKESVRVASTEDLVLFGEQEVDGIPIVSGDRILVKNQSFKSQNGIYVISEENWQRSPDANSNSEVTSGMFCFVEEGETNANSGWVLATKRPIVLGATELDFSQFSGAGQITVAGGLEKQGNEIKVGTADSSRIVINSDNIDLAMTGVPPGEYTRVLVDEYGRVIQGGLFSTSSITSVGTLTSGVWNASVIGSLYGGTGIASYSSKVSIRSPLIDFSQTGDIEIFTVPAGYVFSMDSMEVMTKVVTDPDSAPSIRFGDGIDFEAYCSERTVTIEEIGSRYIMQNSYNSILLFSLRHLLY
jgi:hypothetical protein